MKVAIVTNCVPFVSGGAEYLATALKDKLIEYGHRAMIVSIPFKWQPPSAVIENILACRSLRSPNTDLVIGLKFPAYYLPHHNKVFWLLHQFRQAYDLWGTPYQDLPATPEGESVRKAVIQADNLYLREARKIFTISRVTANRLLKFNSISSEVLYPPLVHADGLRNTGYGDYVFFPSRITAGKRQILLVEAASHLKTAARIVIAGKPETSRDFEVLHKAIAEKGLGARITLIPEFISEERKAKLMSGSLACIYTPYDEDSYGYVTLEACHCRKPTITCTDSGGTSLLVMDRVSGRQVAPDPRSIAEAIDELYADRQLAKRWGEAAYEQMLTLGIHWDHVIRKLTA
jgi:glycosyltransferase involved in cell wall biosynthesis